MTVTVSNLIQGPASLWLAPFGATEPTDIDTAPGAPFVDLGGTDGGVSIGIADEYSVLSVDQIIYEVERRRTKRVVTFKTALAEATLENMAIAMNNTAPVSNVLTADDGLGAFNPDYRSAILQGIAPSGLLRRVLLRKVLSTDSIESSYKKDGMTLIPVTFTGHWISSAVAPFTWEDKPAA